MALSFVVGYQTKELAAGYNIFAPTFDGVGAELDIQDVKLSGVGGEGGEVIWILDENGIATGDFYAWLSAEITGAETDMWTADGETPLKLSLKSGQGLYLYTESEKATVTVSGQVKIGPYTKALSSGYNLTGNFTPVPTDIQNIKLSGVGGEGGEVIWILDENGIATGDFYAWLSAEITGAENDMWTADGETPLAKIIQPGEGLYLYTESETATISLPCVIEK